MDQGIYNRSIWWKLRLSLPVSGTTLDHTMHAISFV